MTFRSTATVVALTGASVLGKPVPGEPTFTERLLAAYRAAGLAVSVIKHAPDGFDIDTPGKASHRRREAGVGETMLVGDRRLVLFKEYGEGRGEPPLHALLRRLDPVDLVLVEGFRAAAVPTLEIHRPSSGRTPRWRHNPFVVAVASDEACEAPVPVFALSDLEGIARFMAAPRHGAVSRLKAV